MGKIRLLKIFGLLSLMVAACIRCSDDNTASWPDVDGAAPRLELATPHIKTEAGSDLKIQGKITDNDGIAFVKLECEGLYLNKTIDIVGIYGEPLTAYDLDYHFHLDNNEVGDSFDIRVSAVDVGSRTTTDTIHVTLDADFKAPEFTLSPDAMTTVLIKEHTIFNLRFSVIDNQALDFVRISVKERGTSTSVFDKEIGLNAAKVFDFSEDLQLPNAEGTYDLKIEAADKAGSKTEVKSVIVVSQLPDFENMYLSDVATVEQLNSDVLGVPMKITHTGEYSYEARYYNEKAGTKIFFLPQKSNFTPICFGIDPANRQKLTDDPEKSQPIVLDKAQMYYKIVFNTKSGDYTVESYPISEAKNPLPQAIGSDYYLDKNQPQYVIPFRIGILYDNPGNVIIMEQDAVNPNILYTKEPLELEAGKNLKGEAGDMQFIIHNLHEWGWWDYCTWRADSSTEPEKFFYYRKSTAPNPEWHGFIIQEDNWAKVPVKKSGKYRMIFDMHLDHIKLIPAE